MIAFDCESHAILPGLLAPPLVCVSFAMADREPNLRNAREGATRIFNLLECRDTLVGHNVAYDMAVLCAYRPELIPLVFQAYAEGRIKDTKVREELIDIANGRRQVNGATMVFDSVSNSFKRADYSLAGLELKYLGRDRSEEKHAADAWRLRYAELDGVPLEDWPEDAIRYAKEDAQGTLDVYLAQEAQAVDGIKTQDENCRAAWALHLMSVWGIRTDGPAVEALETKLLAAKKKNDRRLHQAAFFQPKRASKEDVEKGNVAYWEPPKKAGGLPRPMRFSKDTARIAEYVERVYKRRLKCVAPRTETGRVSMDADTLNQAGSYLLSALADGGGVDKILQTYIPVLKQGTEVPVNARFNVLVNSGRTSSANPNLQNLPSGKKVGGVRECFIPRVGYLFTSVDFDTLELRHLAQRCLLLFGRSKMAEAIRDGKDLHIVMAAQILRLTYEEALTRYKAKDPQLKRARDLAKVANFGMGGGLGALSLVEYARASFGVIMTEAEARKLKADWLNAFPEMVLFFAYVSDKAGALGDVAYTDPVTGYVRGGLRFTSLANHLFQHPAAMGGKAALFQVAYECYVDLGTALFGTRPVAWIHDEIIAEVPEQNAHAASLRLAEVMCKEMATIVKDIPVTASPALMRRWLKAAEAVYVDGELVPWEPKKEAA